MNVLEWLNSARKPYDEGLQLYAKHGGKAVLISIFTKGGASTYNRGRLHKELVIIGERSAPEEIFSLDSTASNKGEDSISPLPAQWRKAQPREVYPVELHMAYDRLHELYALINHLHPQLDALWLTNQKDCFQAKNKLVQAWDEIDEIFTILHYYDDNKSILANKYQEISTDERFDYNYRLMRRNNLRTYISRSKDDPKKLDKLKDWAKEITKLEATL